MNIIGSLYIHNILSEICYCIISIFKCLLIIKLYTEYKQEIVTDIGCKTYLLFIVSYKYNLSIALM